MSFLTTKNKLASILSSLTGTGNPLQSSFGYFEPSPGGEAGEGYPCAMIQTSAGSEEERLDTSSNFLKMSFTIRLLGRTTNTEAGENRLLSALDSILDALRSSTNVDTLGGTVEKFDVVAIDRIEDQTDQPIVGFDISVEASKIKTI